MGRVEEGKNPEGSLENAVFNWAFNFGQTVLVGSVRFVPVAAPVVCTGKAAIIVTAKPVTNVVCSPFFSATSLQKTTLYEWFSIKRKQPGLWTDFESDKLSMPVMKVHRHDPDELPNSGL